MLTTVVVRRGLCLWGLWPEQEPDWEDCAPSDRALAKRLCEGCPVIDQCLELELRNAGMSTTGVWGATCEDDRRALHPIWRRRRQQQEPERSGRRADAMTVNLTPTQVLAVLGVLVIVVMMWRSGTRRAHRAAQAAHAASRVVSLAGHVLITAGVIVGVQWVVITYALGSTLFWVVLALPALIAGHVLTKALTVTSLDVTHRRGDRR